MLSEADGAFAGMARRMAKVARRRREVEQERAALSVEWNRLQEELADMLTREQEQTMAGSEWHTQVGEALTERLRVRPEVERWERERRRVE